MGTQPRHLLVVSLDVNVMGKVKYVSSDGSPYGDATLAHPRGVPGCQCYGQGQIRIVRW